MIAPNKVPLSEAVKSLVVRTRDKTGLTYADYMSFAKDIYIEMNMRGIKDSKRFVIKVNKKTNSIALPDECLQFSTISIYKNGKIVPLITNPKLTEDLIDLSANKQCECGSDLCANINNYEPIEMTVEMVMPDGTIKEFTKTIQKKVNPEGMYVMEVTEPTKKYVDGVYTSVALETTEEPICSLDMTKDGCIADTEANKTKVYTDCGFHDLRHECGCPSLPGDCIEKLEYNINDKGNRILLPSNHSYDYVIVRAYVDVKTRDILIPQVAKKHFMDRLYYAGIEYDSAAPMYRRQEALKAMGRSEVDMIMNLSKMSISDLYNTISPSRTR